MLDKVFRSRIRRFIAAMQDRVPGRCLAVVSSAPELVSSRDTDVPYRADSDLEYLCGAREPGLALLVSSDGAVTLVGPKPDPVQLIWRGNPPPLRSIAKRSGADLVVVDNVRREVMQRCKGFEALLHQDGPERISAKVGSDLLQMRGDVRCGWPRWLGHIDTVLGPLRMIKEPGEVEAIREAARITRLSVSAALSEVQAGWSERELAACIEYQMIRNGAGPAFQTIVGSGPNGATLHHAPGARKLRSNDLIVIDCGARWGMHCADITRVTTLNGALTASQRAVTQIVCDSQDAAIAAIRPGVAFEKVHGAAVEVLAEGLLRLGVLKGPLKQVISKRSYRPYFPHSIGHSLGIDVHDVGNLRADPKTVLAEGMVLTIEPGLYFRKARPGVDACGVRIEDDVLVTRRGPEILSRGLPRTPDEIEAHYGDIE